MPMMDDMSVERCVANTFAVVFSGRPCARQGWDCVGRGAIGEIALAKSSVKNWIKPGVDGANLEVDDFLSKRITSLSALLLRVSTRRYLLEHEISLPEWRALTILVRLGPGTTRELRDASKMDKGQMSRALLALEKRKLLQRSQDETHELRHVLQISEKGLQLYRRIMPNARRAQVALLKQLTIDERRTLDVVINKLMAAAEADG